MSIFGKKPEQEPRDSSTGAAAEPTRPSQPQAAPSTPPPPRPQVPRPGPSAASERRSFLGPGCSFNGELTGEGTFECSGTFDGSIDITGDAVIGHGGKAEAEVKARRISIEGRLHGDATGTEKVEVGASGHVEGDVRAPAVQFAEGAFFEGNVEMRRPRREPSTDADSAGSGEHPAGKSGGSAAPSR